ncbi:hypothetical protein ALC62_00970 [Cyphomyrmex costatus]|uniref:Uncharacterized protein n=1 Tax=Cyphomyrmex costatus TaxID=456900 RepID=A0A195D5F5_9HYME|nr:hypothetical protein ALC62_00970 [Cyphomyrmex costatus]
MEQTRSQLAPSFAIPPCIRRLSGESGWRQLQRDADRKTPRVVTVAPEILLDETDGRVKTSLKVTLLSYQNNYIRKKMF